MLAPPYDSGNWMPINPSPASLGNNSCGKCCASSHSITCGRSSASANSRTLLRSKTCSLVRAKSIKQLYLARPHADGQALLDGWATLDGEAPLDGWATLDGEALLDGVGTP